MTQRRCNPIPLFKINNILSWLIKNLSHCFSKWTLRPEGFPFAISNEWLINIRSTAHANEDWSINPGRNTQNYKPFWHMNIRRRKIDANGRFGLQVSNLLNMLVGSSGIYGMKLQINPPWKLCFDPSPELMQYQTKCDARNASKRKFSGLWYGKMIYGCLFRLSNYGTLNDPLNSSTLSAFSLILMAI